ncbi:MAG: hypothetical protein FD143_2118 [Ignavibacteria bacterium]|nr:MAG: hypothetical protein FD143_2118 [Ignavibacteria bacterium]KAF0158928.1 MAG: hypothetical protein FD188_2410 [Ignavibacteria bacterium]
MTFQKINCPKCNTEIEISSLLTTQIENEVEQRYTNQFAGFKKETEEKIELKIKSEYEYKYSYELLDLKNQISEKEQPITDLAKRELNLKKREREI